MPTTARRTIAALVFTALVGLAPQSAHAADGVKVLVLKEHGVGSAAQAQGFIDKVMGRVAELNGFASAVGKYATTRMAAKTYVTTQKPDFGIVSLPAFLALRSSHGLTVIGTADVMDAGGRRYHVVGPAGGNLASCRGKRLATDHADDPRFLEKVVSGGDFKLADFQLVKTRRPVQTLKKVTRGEADCALIDDAQLDYLPRLEGGDALKSLWKSSELPPMAVVAFPGATKAEIGSFKKNLAKVCTGGGKSACNEAGIRALKPAGEGSYSKVIAAYGG